MTRLYSNNFSTTLSSSITNSATSISVASASGFPAVGGSDTANITVQNGGTVEIMTATAISGTTITVTRGAEGSTAASFASGSIVEIRATAASFTQNESTIVLSDNTTNNVSTSKHGFVPKAPNDAAKYLDGTGSWSVPAGGGGGSSALTLLAVKTVTSGDTAVDFLTYLSSTYADYLIIIDNFTMTSNSSLGMIVSYDGGSTWKNANSYNYSGLWIKSSASTINGYVSPNDASFNISGTNVRVFNATLTLSGVATSNPSLEWKGGGTENGGGYGLHVSGSGVFNDGTTPPVNAIRFTCYGTAMTGGTFRLYGYQKS